MACDRLTGPSQGPRGRGWGKRRGEKMTEQKGRQIRHCTVCIATTAHCCEASDGSFTLRSHSVNIYFTVCERISSDHTSQLNDKLELL